MSEWLRQGGVFLALAVVITIASLLSPDFLTQNNIINILRQASALGIITIGQAICMIGGGFDLSVTAVMQLTTVLMAELTLGRDEWILPVAAFCLVLGLLIGLINGLVVTKRRAAPFMVTLATAVAVTGARLLYTGGTPSGLLPDGLRPLSQGEILGIPISVMLTLGLTVVAWIALRKTMYGRNLYALGANREAARLSGVRVDLVGTSTYVLSGLLASLAGLILAAYIGYADPWLGGGYDLDSIAAAAIGGVSLAGGVGGVWGAMAGVLLIRMLFNVVLLLHLPVEFQYLVRGGVIILAVALYSIRFRHSR
jgi:ribose/xylose/arabinose/galactoside ABC-type transport system permease subunit